MKSVEKGLATMPGIGNATSGGMLCQVTEHKNTITKLFTMQICASPCIGGMSIKGVEFWGSQASNHLAMAQGLQVADYLGQSNLVPNFECEL